jgi:hypothetical protein
MPSTEDSDQKKPANGTKAARRSSDDVFYAMFMAEMEGRTQRGYDVRIIRECERRSLSSTE